MLRHGGGATGGLGTVQRYRRAFRWKRAARLGSNRSADEAEEPEEEEAGGMLLFPLRALSGVGVRERRFVICESPRALQKQYRTV